MTSIHYKARAAGKNQLMIDEIKKEFDSGKHIVEIKTDDALKLRKRLYKLARERNLMWNFSTTKGSVFIRTSGS